LVVFEDEEDKPKVHLLQKQTEYQGMGIRIKYCPCNFF
jgi:hypothetical protein